MAIVYYNEIQHMLSNNTSVFFIHLSLLLFCYHIYIHEHFVNKKYIQACNAHTLLYYFVFVGKDTNRAKHRNCDCY